MSSTPSFILNIFFENNLDENIKNWYINYNTKYAGDSGIDLVCPDIILFSELNSVETINFQIKTSLLNTETGEYSSYYLYPRSSISNTPLIMANSVGIIDSGYRGNLMAKVKYMPSSSECDKKYHIIKGTRLFQICAPNLQNIKVNIVSSIEKLGESNRGEKGFGSSGVGIV
jgi:dUTP pyrophosphatase